MEADTQAQVAFFLTGRRPSEFLDAVDGLQLRPALFAGYRDLTPLRYDFPLVLAAKSAHAHEFIEKLPQGYDTMVGERGSSLSGGQKQRIAIARAFLRPAPLLILDEATSALDSASEAAVQDALRQLVQGKTVLIIAHRFSTIRDASMILVFDQGRIVAQGDHASLYAGNALYKSLYDRQSTAL
jgi:subfamily B ATP-binding cassette protein MsbA